MWSTLLNPGGLREIEIQFRPLTGALELCVSSVDQLAMGNLLSKLIISITLKGNPFQLNELSVTEYDRLLAAIYTHIYDNSVSCHCFCKFCSEAYEFSFSLDTLIKYQEQNAMKFGNPDVTGYWSVADGFRFRAPTRLEAISVVNGSLNRNDFIKKLVSDQSIDHKLFESYLEAAAPTLAIDIAAPCPHCEEGQNVRFDIHRYLVAAISNERAFLIREVHLIASSYGWTHSEIIRLSRSDRRAYAALITNERSSRLRRVS